MRISETPSPTGSQSPKLPNIALRRRARIRALALWSVSSDNHASKTDDRTKVFIQPYCIQLDTNLQEVFSKSLLCGRSCEPSAQLQQALRRIVALEITSLPVTRRKVPSSPQRTPAGQRSCLSPHPQGFTEKRPNVPQAHHAGTSRRDTAAHIRATVSARSVDMRRCGHLARCRSTARRWWPPAPRPGSQ